MENETIAAIASPPGMGAVGLLRLSGGESASVAARIFRGRPRERWRPREQHLGAVVDADGFAVDEVLLTYFPGPKSFTGEDVVEIACHGGVVVTRRILDLIYAAGAVPAGPGEFSQRAFLNGRMDLTQAEAIMDLITAQTDLSARAAQAQLSGGLGNETETIRTDLISLLAHVEAYIDFPDEDIAPDSVEELCNQAKAIRGRVRDLLGTAEQGRLLREGVRTVICGPPNAGKSSLLNLLLGFDRAIVSETPGTTRDSIEEVISLEGIPVRLIDTAGIRESDESIEREGIERSRAHLESAELVLLVVDASAPSAAAAAIQVPDGARVVRILNKSDLPRHRDWDGMEGLAISCLSGDAGKEVRGHLFRELTGERSPAGISLISINSRHQHCLKKCEEALLRAIANLLGGESPEFVSMDLRESLDALGEVTGKTDIEEILGEIFSKFCIGK